MQLFLSLVILPQINILVTKRVKLLHKLIKHCLFSVCVVQERQKLMLDVRPTCQDLFSLEPEMFEDLLHLVLVVPR